MGSFALSWATDGSDWTTGGAEYGAGRAAAATTDGADEAESVVPSLIASAWDVANDAFLAGALAVGCQPPEGEDYHMKGGENPPENFIREKRNHR